MTNIRPDLHNQLEFGQFFQQLTGNAGTVVDEHQHVGIAQSNRKLPNAFDGVSVNLGLKRVQLAGTGQLTHGVLIVIEYDDLHDKNCALYRGCNPERLRLFACLQSACKYKSMIASQLTVGFLLRHQPVKLGAYISQPTH